MKQLKQAVLAATIVAAGLTTAASAQTVSYVTNTYDVRVQQTSAGALTDGTRYVTFAGDAKAVNNKAAADLKAFSFTVFYSAGTNGLSTVSGGAFVIQTTNKDRSPLTVGGNIASGDPITLRANGWFAIGETLSLPLLGNDGTGVSGVITATLDKSSPPRASGTLSLTYPVIGQ